ncbi:MAG: 5-formyltetrahydrofolate cyclo-ligase [Pseudomonadales bacterium]|nr:5-formyltetrahydrofolate cyclo-ligase [Pseudomonadales bacterium]
MNQSTTTQQQGPLALENERQCQRHLIQRRRHRLRAATIQQQSLAVQRQLSRVPGLHNASKIGLYMPSNGELSALALIQTGRHCFIPKIINRKQRTMRLYRQTSATKNLRTDAFDILAPTSKQSVRARSLDVLIMPLVAFNQQGDRMGMGAGFYDRYLAFKAARIFNKPVLVGIGYDWQQWEQLAPQTWDIACDWIATPTRLINCKITRHLKLATRCSKNSKK